MFAGCLAQNLLLITLAHLKYKGSNKNVSFGNTRQLA